MLNVEDLEAFIRNVNLPTISDEDVTNPTLMDIAGFPDRETVFSKILAFFLDSSREHCFDNLMFLSLTNAYCKRNPAKEAQPNFVKEKVEVVDTEFSTTNNKKIDIVITTTSLVIGIENKINANVQNDLAEYSNELENYAKKLKKNVIKILLSPSEKKDKKIIDNKFINVSYQDLIEELKKQESSLNPPNSQYKYLLDDFINQAEKFNRSNKMDEEIKKFLLVWKENRGNMNRIYSSINKINDVLGERAVKYQEEINTFLESNEMKEFYSVKIHKETRIHVNRASKITVDGCSFWLDFKISPFTIETRFRGKKVKSIENVIKEIFPKKLEYTSSGTTLTLTKPYDPFDDNEWSESLEQTKYILQEIYNHNK